jgi:hypothetical protein
MKMPWVVVGKAGLSLDELLPATDDEPPFLYFSNRKPLQPCLASISMTDLNDGMIQNYWRSNR